MMFNINGVRTVNLNLSSTTINTLAEHWKDFAETITPYPDDFEGKGIVICAGGRFFSCCWVLINTLRIDMCCSLPIQVWYSGDEMTPKHIDILSELNVSCHNFLDYEEGEEAEGYMMKPLAIKLSSFREVLYLDADNICLINPDTLFDLPEYKNTGAMFWPDYWITDKNNPIWEIIGCPANDNKEQESGQLLINKEKCWPQINLALYFNVNKHVYYKLLHGDKDTFRFAWLALGKEFYFINHEVASGGYYDEYDNFIGNTMVQYLPDGSIGFLHRNLIKWDKSDINKRVWQKIKKFRTPSLNKEYYTYWDEKKEHSVMNIEGDIDIFDFDPFCKSIEAKSLDYLQYIRSIL